MRKEDLKTSRVIVGDLYKNVFGLKNPELRDWSHSRFVALKKVLKKALTSDEYRILSLRFGLEDFRRRSWEKVALETGEAVPANILWRFDKILKKLRLSGTSKYIKIICIYSELEADIYVTDLFLEFLDLRAGDNESRKIQVEQTLKEFLSIPYDYSGKKCIRKILDDPGYVPKKSIVRGKIAKAMKALEKSEKAQVYLEIVDREMEKVVPQI